MRDLYTNVSSVLWPASPFAAPIDWLFRLTLWIAGVICVGVAAWVFFNVIRYRDRGDEEGEPPQITGSLPVELTWTILPAVLLGVLFYLQMGVVAQINPAPGTAGDEVNITVVGHQWWWEFRYDGTDAVTANEMHIPVGRPIRLHLESADVIHSFWVPRLGKKTDLIPGHPNTLVLQADAPGTYLGTCAEYCGDEHAWMRIRVIASDEGAFQAWLDHEAQPKAEPTTALAEEGRKIFMNGTCASCHVIRGLPAQPKSPVGPDLTHVASRRTLAAGILTNTRGNMLRWLADAQAVKPGTYMPDFRFTPEQLDALAAFLEGTPPVSQAQGPAPPAAGAPANAPGKPGSAAAASLGEQVYRDCAACHQPDGRGVAGTFPPLAGHLPKLYQADRSLPPKIVLFGMSGKIHVFSQAFDGTMPTWAATLSDAQVAAVLNHELTAWGNRDALPDDFRPYTADDIAQVRKLDLSPSQVHLARQKAGFD